MRKWNRRINLVSNADDTVVIQRHFVDSLSCLLAGVITPNSRLLDMGTGAGFPGIPLKIYSPTMQVVAVDAVTKKIMFLRQLCRTLQLERIECLAARLQPAALEGNEAAEAHRTAELLPAQLFDVIVSRAVGSIPLLVSLGLTSLAPSGCLLLQRGREGRQEMEAHRADFRKWGFCAARIIEINLSFLAHPRYLLVLQHGEQEDSAKNKA